MEVDAELLKKYHQNRCTPQEQKAVEEWLFVFKDTDSEVPFPVDEDESELKDLIWSGIYSRTVFGDTKTVVLWKNLLRQPFAACLILISLLTVIARLYLTENRIEYSNLEGNLSKKVNIDHIEFTLKPNSSCIINRAWNGNVQSVKISGAVAVKNTREDESLPISILSSGNKPENLKIRKGETYMVMLDDNGYDIIAATRAEIEDGLPMYFSKRLADKFHIKI